MKSDASHKKWTFIFHLVVVVGFRGLMEHGVGSKDKWLDMTVILEV